jgi:hypothetical protein
MKMQSLERLIHGHLLCFTAALTLLVVTNLAAVDPQAVFGPGEHTEGLYQSRTFGKVWIDPSGYAFIESLGWVATLNAGEYSFWHAGWRGWFWTYPEAAGWIYHFNSGTWIFHHKGGPWFSKAGGAPLHWDFLPVAPDKAKVFRESMGLIIIDTEHAALKDAWHFENRTAGYLGAGYLVWRGTNNYSKREVGVLEFTFDIETEGTYGITLRHKIGGDDRGSNNDLNLSFRGGMDTTGKRIFTGWFAAFTNETGPWSTELRGEIDGNAFSLSRYYEPGRHTLRISPRSGGFLIDRIALFNRDRFSNLSDSVMRLVKPSPFTVETCTDD